MRDIPRDPEFDGTLSLLSEGYRFISARCERNGCDAFRTRLMLGRVLCLRGREAARLLYDGDRVTRRKAMPAFVLRLLQGDGSVETLDRDLHRDRKRLFLDHLGPGRHGGLVEAIASAFRGAVPDWERRGRVELLHESRLAIARGVAAWAGVPLDGDGPDAVPAETAVRWFGEMTGNVAHVGPRTVRALILRRDAERWVLRLVDRARREPPGAGRRTILSAIATHRGLDGSLLDNRIAVYEILNVLRPTVAIARFVVFAALALHEHPDWRARLRARPDMLRPFAHEVRRTAPFFPLIGGIALEPLEWRGVTIPAGTWMLLDLYGTNRHPGIWTEPERFDPARFADAGDPIPEPFGLVPQGAGDHLAGHRCPGEWVTIEAMEALVAILAREIAYDVPPQDLAVRLNRIPAAPESNFLIENVRRIAPPVAVPAP